ncbi:hypothetical protein CEY09_15580 [Achromobacter marplatensis]|uniref:NmrA family NAD(P)-binding protein n=1 Tax=Achromobacter marplatensis TaxID=470868 RepID=UPI000B517923|nr:hypothetical protein CEY09_15580 [Achromobacter marplatensis]
MAVSLRRVADDESDASCERFHPASVGSDLSLRAAFGRRVRALTRDPASAAGQALSAQGVDVVRGDFTDPTSLDAALAGVDGVFQCRWDRTPETRRPKFKPTGL